VPTASDLLWAAAIVVPVYLGRHLIVPLTVPTSVPRSHAVVSTVMVPKGLAAAVLASLPLQAGVEHGARLQSIGYLVVMLSILTTAVLVPLQTTPPGRWLYNRLLGKYPDVPQETPPATRPQMAAERVDVTASGI
jgi:cell volume regulation protein A